MDDPGDPRAFGSIEQQPCPLDIHCTKFFGRTGERNLRGEVDDPLGSIDRAGNVKRIRDRAEDIGNANHPGGSSLQSAHLVAARDKFGGDSATEKTGGPGDKHNHGAVGFPPASTRSAQLDNRDRSIFEL